MAAEPESVDDFRARARAWIRGNLPPSTPSDEVGQLRPRHTDEEELAEVDRSPRSCSGTFFDAGFAGICFPREYGGQGLTPAHQTALQRGAVGLRLSVPHPGADVLAVRGGAPRVRHARSRSSATSRRSSRARNSGCSCCPSRAAAPTSPAR